MPLFKKAMIGGIFLSSLHLCWLVLILANWAQPIMDFIFKLHMLNSPFQVQPFDPILALGLLILTFIVGSSFVVIFCLIKDTLNKI